VIDGDGAVADGGGGGGGGADPDAEVIALSPKTLLATNRFVCEICNKGFQRDQNLQLHRRGHNLPWKLRQRSGKEVRKRVYVCPEPSCVHHDPSRALGDLTGIKKHFCRKHGEKKWKCDKCSKKYAVQSDWKAHVKTCGSREYRCDCGTLFSRSVRRPRIAALHSGPPPSSSIASSSTHPIPIPLTDLCFAVRTLHLQEGQLHHAPRLLRRAGGGERQGARGGAATREERGLGGRRSAAGSTANTGLGTCRPGAPEAAAAPAATCACAASSPGAT
jgi:hypothetical protein